jgi:hypothetical protein
LSARSSEYVVYSYLFPNWPTDRTRTHTNSCQDLLCSAKAWDILTYEEKKQILVKFPDEAEILDPGTANARPNVAALRNNNNFRHDVARYQEGLGKGFHDPEWIRQAQAAHSARQLGFYDEFMAADFREKWDLPMPGQIHTAPAVTSREGSHEVGTCGKGRLNDISLQPAAGVQSEETATQSRCVDDATHGKLTEATVRDTQDNQEGTENRRVALGDDMSKTENKGTVRPLESKVKQEGLPEAESVTTGPSTKLGGQQLEDSHYDATALRVPSLPIIMEGVEHESEKEHAGTTKTQHSVKEVETLQITDIPKTVESTRRTEDFANRVQQPDEKKVQSDSSAEQQPGDESRCSAVSARHGSRHY